MSRYLNQPTLYVDFLRPKRMSFDNPGAGIGGGKNALGESVSTDFSGGGIITGTYEQCVIFGQDHGDDERHEYINMLGARLNGGFRFINVPIVNDGIGPFPVINGRRRPLLKGIEHSDGSLFSDGAGYSQATVWGEILEDAPLNAGIVKMRVYDAARSLRWSDWFSILHESKGWRAYRYWDVLEKGNVVIEAVPINYDREYLLTVTNVDTLEYLLNADVGGLEYLLTSKLAITEHYQRTYQDYTLAVSPPLREATPVGTRVELARPTCVMKFADGFTLPFEYEANYQARPTLSFVEAF